MNDRTKYLSLLILLTFTVGQVQYGHTTYFCTMLNLFLPSQSAAASMQEQGNRNDACYACQGTTSEVTGNPTIESNCFEVINLNKDVVSSFLGSTVPVVYKVCAFVLTLSQPQVSRSNSRGMFVAPAALSPPLDLPTLNSNLRI